MDLVYQGLVVLHLLGMAAIVGGAAAEWVARRDQVPVLVLHGAGLQLLTGIALVGLGSSGAVEVEVNNAKVAVKLAVALAVFTLALAGRRVPSFGRVGLSAAGGLALVNVVVAVFW